uniref:Uncharacterized protein n=1 Tax=Nelumbo nucifera TaxID=4432 RepID=A0A822ZVM0_NELNU|nr:TPA_asm: hypothetical protein HUJ06_004198 [Nelumbo nucifera]
MQKQTIHTKDDQILAIVGRNSLSHCDGASSPSDRLPSSTLMEIVQVFTHSSLSILLFNPYLNL